MNRSTQLIRLIWDFYRENQRELKLLKHLAQCKLLRWWGVLHIHCTKPEIAKAIIAADGLLEEPVTQLRLANTIKIWVNGSLFAVLPVKSDKMLAK
jgi:hypothetical protein